MQKWQKRMEHERAWRDSGVELGFRSAPKVKDEEGSLGIAGPLRKSSPALWQKFLEKGHDFLDFDQCKCSKD